MKKFDFAKLAAIPAIMMALALPAAAQLKNTGAIKENVKQAAGSSYNVTDTGTDLSTVLGTVIGSFLALMGTLFVILMIYAGYLYMTAQGNEEQVEKAKDMIKNAVIGIVIVFLAFTIQYTVFSYLTTQQQ